MKYQAQLATLALALSALPSHAAVLHAEASSKIANLSIRAVDLVPSDGLAPSFSLLDKSTTWAWGPNGTEEVLPGFLTALTMDQTGPGVLASGTIGPGSMGLSLIADSEHPNLTAGLMSRYEYSNTGPQGNVRLSPGSALVISGTFDMALKLECPVSCSALTYLSVVLASDDQSSGSGHSLNSLFDGTDASYSSPFTVTYSNYSNFDQYLRLNISAVAEMSTVPEPGHMALLLAGLVIAAAVQRKRA